MNKKEIEQIEKERHLSNLALIKQSRLSVMSIDKNSWKLICKMGGIHI